MALRASVFGMGAGLVFPIIFFGLGVASLAAECKLDALAVAGQTLTERECGKCHPLNQGSPSLQIGPNIVGVFGAKAARRADYHRYSEAMMLAAAKGLTWDERTLDAYITDPKALLVSVSGNLLAKHGMFYKMPDRDKRKRIVAYLKASSACSVAPPPS